MSKLSFKLDMDQDFAEFDPALKRDMKMSTLEGAFTTLMGTLIGGAFLTGFAISLGADSFIIGILASLPLLANTVQIFGSYLIDRMGDTREVCIRYVLLHRIFWLLIIFSPFLLLRLELTDLRIWTFVVLLAVASLCASISSVSWTSWMADLIPQKIRGRFFASRNMISQMIGMLTAILAGFFVDYWQGLSENTQSQSYGFIYLFAIGTIFGFISIFLLKKTSKSNKVIRTDGGFLKKLKLPFKYVSYKHLIVFTACWGFAVSLVSPFFSVYMIKTLEIPFTLITLFGVVSGITGIIGMRLWGRFIDKYGPKPLLYLCSIGASIIPTLWIFASPDNYTIIWFINIISGFFWAGIGLASSNMMMNLAPSEDNAVFFAVFAAITGITAALAPIFGGYLGTLYNNIEIFSITGLKLLFITSSILRLSTILLLRRIRIINNATIKEVFAKFNSWYRFLPIYNMSRFSVFNLNYRGNITFLVTRGMINIELMLEELMKKKKKILWFKDDLDRSENDE
ncbi:MAG: MFS transporter [Halanaerobiales bacterium]